MTRLRAWWTWAVVGLVIVAGCLQARPGTGVENSTEDPPPTAPDHGADPGDPPSHGEDPRDWIPIRLDKPTYLNSTPQDGQFRLRVEQFVAEDDWWPCGSSEEWVLKVRPMLFDRSGKVWETYYRFDLDQHNHTFTIPAKGEPPFALVGDFSSCIDDEFLSGVDAVHQPPFDRTTLVHGRTIDLNVSTGENRTEVTWEPTETDFALAQAFVDQDNRSGERYGTVRQISEHAGEVCTETFHRTGGWSADCLPFVMYPGYRRIVLELDQPAVLETSWEFHIDTVRFHDGVCDLGFEWEGLCA